VIFDGAIKVVTVTVFALGALVCARSLTRAAKR
jgi:hypothetical protein